MPHRSLTALLFVFLYSAALPAGAKCAMQKTPVNGQVVSGDAQPVGNALVTVRWDEERTNDVSAETRTEADGSFELTLHIDSFDGRTLLGKEQCGFEPDRFSVEVRHAGHRDFRRNYPPAALSEPLRIEMR
jgi:hypothetical protein